VALADIINKIRADADEEAGRILEVAESRAGDIVAAAEQRAEEHRASTLAEAETSAQREADRIVVSARLEARDAALTARRELMDEALAKTAATLASVSDIEYAGFLARRIAAVARGGETLRFGSADLGRSEAVIESLRMNAPGLVLNVASEPAEFERGVVVEGSRVRADLSLEAIVEERRDELELVAAEVLFGEGA
jgi:vacuolar-type H+-ATPase subunit E/Vma4